MKFADRVSEKFVPLNRRPAAQQHIKLARHYKISAPDTFDNELIIYSNILTELDEGHILAILEPSRRGQRPDQCCATEMRERNAAAMNRGYTIEAVESNPVNGEVLNTSSQESVGSNIVFYIKRTNEIEKMVSGL